jgi:hypothetical protein
MNVPGHREEGRNNVVRERRDGGNCTSEEELVDLGDRTASRAGPQDGPGVRERRTNGSTLHHKATLVGVVRLLNGFGSGTLDRRLLLAAIPDEVMAPMVGNTDLALDGTEMESCGQLQGEPSDIDYDGEASPPDDAEQKKTKNAKRKAKVLSVGPDGRNVYTKDKDARGGYRTGNANHPGGTYVGRELHLGIAVPTIKNTDGVSYVKLGPDVPQVVVTARLVPAGSHRGDPAVEMVAEAKAQGLCNGVIVDRGYTQSAPDRFHLPLQRLGVSMFTRLKEHQRGEKPGIGPARLIDGHLFCDSLPDELVAPPMPPLGSTEEEKLPYMAKFDQRAAYRYGRLKAPGTDGVTRWKHPVKNGTLRGRRVPASMRKNRTPHPSSTWQRTRTSRR